MLLALLLAATSLGVSEAVAQTRQEDMTELWERYPLEAPEEGSRSVGAREEDGSKAGPPPRSAEPGGLFALALLFLVIGLTVAGVAGALYRPVARLLNRNRRSSRPPDSAVPSRAENHQA